MACLVFLFLLSVHTLNCVYVLRGHDFNITSLCFHNGRRRKLIDYVSIQFLFPSEQYSSQRSSYSLLRQKYHRLSLTYIRNNPKTKVTFFKILNIIKKGRLLVCSCVYTVYRYKRVVQLKQNRIHLS